MAADHLNSMHLDLGRREEFRRARERVLSACGAQTAHGRVEALPRPAAGDRTMPEPGSGGVVLVEQNRLRHPLRVGVNSVGRLPDNDVVVADPHVSRRHFTILVHASRACEIHDVASKNGTYLNGNRVTGPMPLKSGDEIRVGDLVLTFLNAAGQSSDNTNVDVAG